MLQAILSHPPTHRSTMRFNKARAQSIRDTLCDVGHPNSFKLAYNLHTQDSAKPYDSSHINYNLKILLNTMHNRIPKVKRPNKNNINMVQILQKIKYRTKREYKMAKLKLIHADTQQSQDNEPHNHSVYMSKINKMSPHMNKMSLQCTMNKTQNKLSLVTMNRTPLHRQYVSPGKLRMVGHTLQKQLLNALQTYTTLQRPKYSKAKEDHCAKEYLKEQSALLNDNEDEEFAPMHASLKINACLEPAAVSKTPQHSLFKHQTSFEIRLNPELLKNNRQLKCSPVKTQTTTQSKLLVCVRSNVHSRKQ